MKSPTTLALGLSLFLPLTACGDSVAEVDTTPPASAKDAAERMFSAVQAQELGNVWALMPASYQKDVEGILSTLSTKVDKDVYNKSMATLGTLVSTLRDKQPMIVDLIKQQAEGQMPEGTDIGKIVTVATDFLDGIVGSDRLATTEKLGSLDIGPFLNETGQKIIPAMIAMGELSGAQTKDPEILAMLKGDTKVQVTEVSSDGDKAEIEIDIGGKKETAKMVKVGDRWVPAEMQSDWTNEMAKLRKEIEGMPAMDAQQKAQFETIIGMVDKLLADLGEAESGEELMEIVQASPIMQKVGPLMRGF